MCGISGQLRYAIDAPADSAVVRRMTAALTHRGPDDEGIFLDGPVCLGQRRLSIIDPAGGHQPMSNEDGSVWITYNGTIYNSPELREQLRAHGHRFRTRSDTEVIVHAYEEWGLDSLSRLNGMYAFALWDSRARRLVLARDPFGVKPLYVQDDGHSLCFASELKALLIDPARRPDIDTAALDQYLTFGFVPSPRTIVAGVQKLAPGHCLIVADGTVRTVAFASETPEPLPHLEERAAQIELQERLLAAVDRQMLSDVPVGALLSGGIDSAAVVALMRQVANQPLETFTVGFAGDFALDELVAGRRSAALLGSEHHELVIGAEDCLDILAKAVWHLDEPIATPSALAMYCLSRLAAEHVKVVLTGQGADELWAGYRRHRGERLGRWYRCLPLGLRRLLVEPVARQLGDEKVRRAFYALGADDPAQRFARAQAVFTPAMKRGLYRDRLAAAGTRGDGTEQVRYWQAPVAHLDPLAQQLYVESRFSLPDDLLMYGDKMSMAFGLEARVPLLDLELVKFVERLPIAMRLRGWAGHKYLLRKAVRRWLPDEILGRRKIGFATPMAAWLRGPLAAPLRDRIAAPGSACARYFDLPHIEALIAQHRRGMDQSRALYALLVFECWHEQFVAS